MAIESIIGAEETSVGEIPRIEAEVNVGEMPHPKYLAEIPYGNGLAPIRWIGVRAHSPEGGVGDYLWWGNYQVGDFRDEGARRHLAEFIAGLDAEIVVGKPIDIYGCDPSQGTVAVLERPDQVGLYVERDKRLMWNFFHSTGGTELILDPGALQERVEKILAVMPRP